jgi:transposase InsO family protein
MWTIDATGCQTDEGNAAVIVIVGNCTGECLGVRAALRGTRFDVIECLREAVHFTKGRHEDKLAKDKKLRHDQGSQITSHAFQNEPRTLGIELRPSLVRQPEGNGCVERFLYALEEQLLWTQRFRTVEELSQALCDFAPASSTTGSSGGSATERPQCTDASPKGRPREHQLQLVSETGCDTPPTESDQRPKELAPSTLSEALSRSRVVRCNQLSQSAKAKSWSV